MEDLDKIIKFVNEIERLKCVKRQNYTLDQRFENSAEHSWHASVLALLLLNKHRTKLDHLKVIKMLLIHDLVEIYAGDVFIFDTNAREDIKGKELESINILKDILPEELGNDLKDLWIEFEEEKTEEAKFASSIDGLQPLLNHYNVKPNNFNPCKIKVSQVYEKKGYIKEYTPYLWPLTKSIIEKSVDKGLYYGNEH